MDECKGLLGKIFGHKLKSYLIKDEFPNKMEGKNLTVRSLKILKNKEYEVRCKRCGKRPEE